MSDCLQVMLVGQDERSLGALVVLNVAELASQGLLSQETASLLKNALGSTPIVSGILNDKQLFEAETAKLNNDPAVKLAVMKDISKVCHRSVLANK